MELMESKLIAMVALGLGSMLAGLLPGWFSSYNQQQRPLFLSFLLCFGGGVLLATSLIHMLPEIREGLAKYQNYAELIVCAGFFIIYLIDEIVHYFCGDSHTHLNEDNRNNTHNKIIRRRHSFSYQQRSGYGSTTEYQPLLYDEYTHRQVPYNPNFYETSRTNNSIWDQDRPPSQLCHVEQEQGDASSISNVGLLVALSIHAFLEGLAVGLQKSSSQVLLFLGAIASHKIVVGFCLGAELSSSAVSACRYFVSILVFALGTVLGITTGMIIIEVPRRILNMAFPILQGLAAGTLLYVTVSEVLPRERARWHKHHHCKSAGILQFLSVLIGFVIMTVITLLLGEGSK